MTDDIPTGDEKKSFLARLMRPKVAIPLFLLFLLLISPLLIRSWYLRGVPDLPEPFDAEPLLSLKVSAADNAFTDYRAAEAVYTQPEFEVDELRDEIFRHGWHLANDEIRQYLHDNESAMLAWKQGTEKDRALHIPAKDYHAQVNLQLIRRMREFHRTAMLLCLQLEAEGNPQAAWEWYRAAIRSSRHVGQHGCMLDRLLGTSCFQSSAAELETWAAHPGLTSGDLKLAVRQLQEDWKLTERTSTVLKLEYLAFQKTLKQLENGELYDNIHGRLESAPTVQDELIDLTAEYELSRRLYKVYYRHQLDYCDRPRFERPELIAEYGLFDDPAGFRIEGYNGSCEDFQTLMDRSLRTKNLGAIFPQFYRALDREEARYRSLLVVLAGQAFQRDRGQFPNTLDVLVPDYLDAIPTDTCDGKPLKYRFDPAGPVVYSIFENLTDDGGFEWSEATLPEGKRRPDDVGSQMRLPSPRPLTAPKP